MADFSARLKSLRLEQNLTQQEVADRLNVGKMTISGYERGKRRPDFEKLDALADLFNVSIAYLMGSQDDRGSYPQHEENNPFFIDAFEEQDEQEVLQAYRLADRSTKRAVRRVLDLK